MEMRMFHHCRARRQNNIVYSALSQSLSQPWSRSLMQAIWAPIPTVSSQNPPLPSLEPETPLYHLSDRPQAPHLHLFYLLHFWHSPVCALACVTLASRQRQHHQKNKKQRCQQAINPHLQQEAKVWRFFYHWYIIPDILATLALALAFRFCSSSQDNHSSSYY